jgi:hypothetical protein
LNLTRTVLGIPTDSFRSENALGDPIARKEIDADLKARGYSPSKVLAQAYIEGAAEIDAVEQRIASYEK